MSKRIYTVEVYGDNNTFTIEATAYYEPTENMLTGLVRYYTRVETAMLVHGKRRRNVTDLLTEEQEKQITDEIDRVNLIERSEGMADRAERAREARLFTAIDCPNIGVEL